MCQVHLVKRYPGGSTDRWERIAEWMGRSVGEVTYMAAKLKENCYRVPGGGGPEADNSLPGAAPEELPRKQKTRGGKALPSGPTDQEPEWTQLQQKALETALAKHPKGPADRWDKIAKCVPDKTKVKKYISILNTGLTCTLDSKGEKARTVLYTSSDIFLTCN